MITITPRSARSSRVAWAAYPGAPSCTRMSSSPLCCRQSRIRPSMIGTVCSLYDCSLIEPQSFSDHDIGDAVARPRVPGKGVRSITLARNHSMSVLWSNGQDGMTVMTHDTWMAPRRYATTAIYEPNGHDFATVYTSRFHTKRLRNVRERHAASPVLGAPIVTLRGCAGVCPAA